MWVSWESDSFTVCVSLDGVSISLEIAWRGRQVGSMRRKNPNLSRSVAFSFRGEGDGRDQILLEQSK